MEVQDTHEVEKRRTIRYIDGREQYNFNNTVKDKLITVFDTLNQLITRSNDHTQEITALITRVDKLTQQVDKLEEELTVQRRRTSRFRNRLYDLEDK